MLTSRRLTIRQWVYGLMLWLLSLWGMPQITMSAEQPVHSRAEFERRLAQNPNDAASHYELGRILATKRTQRDVESALTHLETAIHLAPDSLKYGNGYRMMCVKFYQVDRSVKFLEQAVKDMEKANQDFSQLRQNLAFAYVDKLSSSDIGLVTQGRLSKKSVNQLEKVLAKDRDSWLATFGVGMNYLYWPKILGKAPQSIEAFQKCIAFQEAQIKQTGEPKPYFVRTYLGLGDAYIKDKKFSKAREIWRQAQVYFPDDAHLKLRLEFTVDKALGQKIDRERKIGSVIDTDLTVLWCSEPVYRALFEKR